MKLTFIKTQTGLIPDCDETREILNKVKNGDGIILDYKPKRNIKFHRRLFALLNLIFQNQNHYKSIDNILEMCKFKAGYFETIITHKGEKHYKAKSISFDEMDNASFEEFYKKCIDVALELTGISQEDLEQQIINFM